MQVPRRRKALWSRKLSLGNRDGILSSVSSLIVRQEKGGSGTLVQDFVLRLLPKSGGTADGRLDGRLNTSGMAKLLGSVLEQYDEMNVSTRLSC